MLYAIYMIWRTFFYFYIVWLYAVKLREKGIDAENDQEHVQKAGNYETRLFWVTWMDKRSNNKIRQNFDSINCWMWVGWEKWIELFLLTECLICWAYQIRYLVMTPSDWMTDHCEKLEIDKVIDKKIHTQPLLLKKKTWKV